MLVQLQIKNILDSEAYYKLIDKGTQSAANTPKAKLAWWNNQLKTLGGIS